MEFTYKIRMHHTVLVDLYLTWYVSCYLSLAKLSLSSPDVFSCVYLNLVYYH